MYTGGVYIIQRALITRLVDPKSQITRLRARFVETYRYRACIVIYVQDQIVVYLQSGKHLKRWIYLYSSGGDQLAPSQNSLKVIITFTRDINK